MSTLVSFFFYLNAFSTTLICFWLECTGYWIHFSWVLFYILLACTHCTHVLQVRLCREKKSGNIYAMKKLKKSEMLSRGQVKCDIFRSYFQLILRVVLSYHVVRFRLFCHVIEMQFVCYSQCINCLFFLLLNFT